MTTATLMMLLAFAAPATAGVAANVARCESSARYDDGAAVLATLLTRVYDTGRPLLVVATRRYQFAWRCSLLPRTPSVRHLILGITAALGAVHAPPWAWGSVQYCGPSDSASACHEERARRLGTRGRIVHTFYGPRGRR